MLFYVLRNGIKHRESDDITSAPIGYLEVTPYTDALLLFSINLVHQSAPFVHGGSAQAWRPVKLWFVPLFQPRVLGPQLWVLALVRNMVGVVADFVKGVPPLLFK